ncbi:BirA family biotin operon repressor/biotin-[acetyl-CoA-carboxylase] ligase [Arthrobacter silviterrae]|uniref:Biotin--[acetyl-CoA-carboxylase] ligase n=1 Tax=Arthrobacter silviterrae TaxID=2026658 RepID=A0ABX0D9Q4_9MICC|nr:biotin--[acetyl-CoA-carboxylase] ligase [Arthrobacter silviterrae]MDQ0279379.1 BirA family biotin operon repressor/biotin-[acetyl-CoA-carboxylase] ligase [Arthrobacter silviterrae]NGN83423.1 biotin--[acetyl-CoA-carboxylase] ligase [Arthrobacter silviterrae]
MSRTLPALDERSLLQALTHPAGAFRRVDVVAQLGSSNADLAAGAAARPAQWPDLSVLIADSQIAGKGRLDRVWEVPAGSAMISSVLFRPGDPDAHAGAPAFDPAGYGWLSILAGVALCEAVRSVAGVPAVLKWPNDVVANGRKLAGILAQLVPAPATRHPADGSLPAPGSPASQPGTRRSAEGSAGPGPAVVVGAGLNVGQGREQLPVDRATSLALELDGGQDGGAGLDAAAGGAGAAALDRNVLLPAYLNRFARLYEGFVSVGGDALRPLPEGASVHDLASRLMSTLGTEVRAELPGGQMLHGTAVRLRSGGELELRDGDGALHVVSAGDVVHLRRTLDGGGVGYV